MFHARLVQEGKRKPFSWVLLWDIPIALGMGWVSLGLGLWLGLNWEVLISFALVVSYLGPYGIDTLFDKWAEFKFGGKDGKIVVGVKPEGEAGGGTGAG